MRSHAHFAAAGLSLERPYLNPGSAEDDMLGFVPESRAA